MLVCTLQRHNVTLGAGGAWLGWHYDVSKKLYKDEKYLHPGTEGGTMQASNLLSSLLAVFNALLILLNIHNKKLEFCLG